MRRFQLPHPAAIGDTCKIHGADVNHIKNVLRLAVNSHIQLFDTAAGQYTGRITEIGEQSVAVMITDVWACQTESPLFLTATVTLLKDKKMDILVRQLTELGISRWLPIFSERCIPKPDAARVEKRLARWQNIARESLKQCERGLLPEICQPVNFDRLLADGPQYDLALIFSHRQAPDMASVAARQAQRPGSILFMIGPEGGFSPAEIDQAEQAGFWQVSLGPRILKADTAAISACALIQEYFGDI